MDVINEVFNKSGGASALARTLGIAASTPIMWRSRGRIPAEYCPAIEAATGVRCEDMRPDVNWAVVRGAAQPELAAPAQKEASDA